MIMFFTVQCRILDFFSFLFNRSQLTISNVKFTVLKLLKKCIFLFLQNVFDIDMDINIFCIFFYLYLVILTIYYFLSVFRYFNIFFYTTLDVYFIFNVETLCKINDELKT